LRRIGGPNALAQANGEREPHHATGERASDARSTTNPAKIERLRSDYEIGDQRCKYAALRKIHNGCRTFAIG
jgi:hypothetical protein